MESSKRCLTAVTGHRERLQGSVQWEKQQILTKVEQLMYKVPEAQGGAKSNPCLAVLPYLQEHPSNARLDPSGTLGCEHQGGLHVHFFWKYEGKNTCSFSTSLKLTVTKGEAGPGHWCDASVSITKPPRGSSASRGSKGTSCFGLSHQWQINRQ